MTLMLPPLRFTGATILRDGVLSPRSLVVENGKITRGPLPEVDLSGYLVLPGIIDMHGDAFERHIAPRPSAPFPVTAGLRATDRDAASNGVTTAWLAQCWSWEGGMRGPDFAERVFAALDAYRQEALVDLRIQIRCETHLIETRDRMIAAIERHGIDYVIFNNHLPEGLEMAYSAPHKLADWAAREKRSPEDFMAILKTAATREKDVPRHLCSLAEAFDRLGVSYGSHDDPDGETREMFRLMGARIAEFPTHHSAAAVAKACNDPVVMGAPNVVRGGSQSGNIAASRLITRGLCDALVSDYHYPSLAAAAWTLVDSGTKTLPEAWAMISSTPAEIMRLTDRGRLEPGKRADFVIVNECTREIEATISGGRVAYMAGAVASRFLHSPVRLMQAAE